MISMARLALLLISATLSCSRHAPKLPWHWGWDEPVHTLTWGTSSWVNCSGLTPHGTPGYRPNCMDSERELDIMLQHDVVYVQGFDFGRELNADDFRLDMRG